MNLQSNDICSSKHSGNLDNVLKKAFNETIHTATKTGLEYSKCVKVFLSHTAVLVKP